MRFLHEMHVTAQRQLDGMTVNIDVMATDVKQLIATFNQVICIAEDSTLTEREAVQKILTVTNRIKGGEVMGDRDKQAQSVAFKYTAGAQAMRDEWKFHGGTIHGPNTETVCMPESKYFEFRRKLTSSMPEQNAAQPVQQASKSRMCSCIECVPDESPADVVRELVGALRGLLALDQDHQRGYDDQDVCAEVAEARAALAKAKEHGL